MSTEKHRETNPLLPHAHEYENATTRDRDNKGMHLAGSLKSPSFVKSSTPSDYIIKESEHNVDGKLLSHLSLLWSADGIA